MGILTSAEKTYYLTGGDHGNYRFISLTEIIDSFAATYVGAGKLCENVVMADITFHAIRSLQELSYDTLKCTKDWEVVVPTSLMLVMPVDYVNYVKLTWSNGDGIQRVMYPAIKTSNPKKIKQDSNGDYSFDFDGDDFEDTSSLIEPLNSTTWDNYKSSSSSNDNTVNTSDAQDSDIYDYTQRVTDTTTIIITHAPHLPQQPPHTPQPPQQRLPARRCNIHATAATTTTATITTATTITTTMPMMPTKKNKKKTWTKKRTREKKKMKTTVMSKSDFCAKRRKGLIHVHPVKSCSPSTKLTYFNISAFLQNTGSKTVTKKVRIETVRIAALMKMTSSR